MNILLWGKMNKTKIFCELVRKRTKENKNGMLALHREKEAISPMTSVLRQELDSGGIFQQYRIM